jgi:tetratricopeptide (TPR) repeat protein
VETPLEPTPIPTRSGASYQADAEAALAVADYDGALAAYRQMSRLEPDNATPYVALSQLYLLLQDLTQAYEMAQEAVALAPDDPDALAALARAEDWRGDYEEAINHALDALEIDPEHVQTLAVLAEIYTDVGNWDVAQDYLNQAFALDASHILAWRNQAYLYERQGEYERAVEAYTAALELAPERYDLYIEQGRQYRIGLLEYERANESYRQAVEVYESPVTLDALGFGLYNVGDHLQAIRTLRRAVELDPNYGPAQVHLGMALYARRNYEDTVPSLERGVELLGENARVEHLYTLGLAHIFKDPSDCEEAEIWLRKALEIEPESGPALEGMALCNRDNS